MKKLPLLFSLLFALLISCTPTSESETAEEVAMKAAAPVSAAEKAINQAVLNAYNAISFEVGTTPNYEALKAIFAPDAMFYNFRGDTLEGYNIDEFLVGFKAGIEGGNMTGFNEIELGGETEYFGSIGHRISAYGSYINGADEMGEKGVNSFQLLKIDGKWLVSSIIWDVEKEGQEIPERYLSK